MIDRDALLARSRIETLAGAVDDDGNETAIRFSGDEIIYIFDITAMAGAAGAGIYSGVYMTIRATVDTNVGVVHRIPPATGTEQDTIANRNWFVGWRDVILYGLQGADNRIAVNDANTDATATGTIRYAKIAKSEFMSMFGRDPRIGARMFGGIGQ